MASGPSTVRHMVDTDVIGPEANTATRLDQGAWRVRALPDCLIDARLIGVTWVILRLPLHHWPDTPDGYDRCYHYPREKIGTAITEAWQWDGSDTHVPAEAAFWGNGDCTRKKGHEDGQGQATAQ